MRSLDKSQDWRLIDGRENTTHTVLQFSRKYFTCDTNNDLEIYENEYELSNIVWEYSSHDPDHFSDFGGTSIKGVIHQNLFTSVENSEPKETDLDMNNYWMNVMIIKLKKTLVYLYLKIAGHNGKCAR